MPSVCERRSLLTGISNGEPLRREISSKNHTRPGQNGATSNRWTPSWSILSRTPGNRAIGKKGVQTEPRPSLYHSIQPQWSWMSQREPKGTVRCLTSCKQILFLQKSLAKNSPYLLHHLRLKHPFPELRPLPRQDICSHIKMPRNITCSQREEFSLVPHKDLVCQLAQGERT